MQNDFNFITLFEEMLLSEKLSSINTRRAYKKDIELFIEFIHDRFKISILDVSTIHISKWLVSLQVNNLSRSSHSRKMSSIKVFISVLIYLSSFNCAFLFLNWFLISYSSTFKKLRYSSFWVRMGCFSSVCISFIFINFNSI